MTSIIKVDQIQNAAGGVPTAADLGISLTPESLPTGNVLQRIRVHPLRRVDGLGEYGSQVWSTSSTFVWHTPTYGSNPYQITFNAISPSSTAIIRIGGSVYGSGGVWNGLHRDAIVSTSNNSYVFPVWRQGAVSTTENHHSFYLEREMDSSYLSGQTWMYQIYPHAGSSSAFYMTEDLFFEITEIAG